MKAVLKIGIIICDRYRSCAGGKCFRALRQREGAFSIYQEKEIEIVGFTSCGGCPGGNVEYAPEELKRNGAQVIHFATGLVVGYPPCPYLSYFQEFIKTHHEMDVVMGTHPIPQKYMDTHQVLGTWNSPEWHNIIKLTITDKKTRATYD